MEDTERDAPCTACGETPQLQKDDGVSDGQRQLTDAEDLVGEQRLKIQGADGSHGDRLAQSIEDLDGVCSLTIGCGMEINDLHDIPGAKTMFGNVTSQDGIGIEFGVGVRFHDVSGAEQMELF
jgi:hypothetical protein